MYAPPHPVEHGIYQDPQVLVTTARFVVNGTTYPVRGLTAVQYVERPADYAGAAKVLLGGIAVGLVAAMFGSSGAFATCAAAGAILAAVVAAGQKPLFVIRVATAGGQMDAFSTHDKARAGAVASALNRAVAGG